LVSGKSSPTKKYPYSHFVVNRLINNDIKNILDFYNFSNSIKIDLKNLNGLYEYWRERKKLTALQSDGERALHYKKLGEIAENISVSQAIKDYKEGIILLKNLKDFKSIEQIYTSLSKRSLSVSFFEEEAKFFIENPYHPLVPKFAKAYAFLISNSKLPSDKKLKQYKILREIYRVSDKREYFNITWQQCLLLIEMGKPEIASKLLKNMLVEGGKVYDIYIKKIVKNFLDKKEYENARRVISLLSDHVPQSEVLYDVVKELTNKFMNLKDAEEVLKFYIVILESITKILPNIYSNSRKEDLQRNVYTPLLHNFDRSMKNYIKNHGFKKTSFYYLEILKLFMMLEGRIPPSIGKSLDQYVYQLKKNKKLEEYKNFMRNIEILKSKYIKR